MKKIIFSFIAVSMSLAAMATQTAFVRVSLSSVAHPSDASCEIKLVENDARTSAYESGYDAKSMATLSNDYSVLFYAFVGTEKCSDVATNDLTGLELGFTTNNVDTEYKLSFNLFSGNAFNLYDRVENTVTVINASTPDYVFSAPAGRVAVDDRFVIGGTPIVALCFNYNILDVMGHAGESLVIKQGDTEIANVASLSGAYHIDLSGYTGRLVVTLNGVDYQIDANPTLD